MARAFDLACQYALNRYDLEIEKARLSIWGDPKDKPDDHNQKANQKPKQPQRQTMTAKDIMRNYK